MPDDPIKLPAYDPVRHDTQLVAAFEHRQRAEHAQRALVGAGLPAEIVEVVDDPAVAVHEAERFWLAMRRLFAPDEEVHDLSKAIRNGRALVIVHPQTVAERETAIAVLEAFGPIDLDERDKPALPELNHASLSRADLIAAGTPRVPADPPMPPPAPTSPPTTSYTYGVPETVARSMTAAEQTLAQVPDTHSSQHSVRIVEERLRVGWRDRTAPAARVRLYVAERSTPDRIKLHEDEVPASTDRSTN